jgi:hypothetical protein
MCTVRRIGSARMMVMLNEFLESAFRRQLFIQAELMRHVPMQKNGRHSLDGASAGEARPHNHF